MQWYVVSSLALRLPIAVLIVSYLFAINNLVAFFSDRLLQGRDQGFPEWISYQLEDNLGQRIWKASGVNCIDG